MRARPSDFVRRLGTYTGKLSDDPERMAKTKVPALTGRPKRYRLSCDRASPFANILQTRLPSATTRGSPTRPRCDKPVRRNGQRHRAGSPTTRTSSAERKSSEARSEEHTSELQSLMRISYAVFCLKKKTSQEE